MAVFIFASFQLTVRRFHQHPSSQITEPLTPTVGVPYSAINQVKVSLTRHSCSPVLEAQTLPAPKKRALKDPFRFFMYDNNPTVDYYRMRDKEATDKCITISKFCFVVLPRLHTRRLAPVML